MLPRHKLPTLQSPVRNSSVSQRCLSTILLVVVFLTIGGYKKYVDERDITEMREVGLYDINKIIIHRPTNNKIPK